MNKRRYLNVWILATLFLLCSVVFTNAKTVKAQSVQNYDYVVTDFGGVNATDKASDYIGIQEALDRALGSKSMITIYFPAGDYYVNRTLKVYSNTHIILDTKATVHRMDSIIDKGLIYNYDQNGERDRIGGYDMSQNIILEGGTWDGGNIKKASKGTDVMRFDHAQNITIKDCTVKNTYDCHILELVGVKNGTVSGCTFTGFRYAKGKEKNYVYAREAIQLESAWTSNEKNLSDQSSAWAKGSVIDGTSCQQVTVTECKFINVPCGVGQHRYTKSGKYRNIDISILNNTFSCSKSYKYCKTAITCCGTNNLIVSNNKVTGPYRFSIHVIKSTGVVINENRISNIKMNGIMVDKGVVKSISNNTLKNIGKHGISVGGGTVNEISNNTVTNAKVNGLSVDDGTVSTIIGNKISNSGKHGISIAGGNIKKITANTINKAKQNGICMSKGKVAGIEKNTIKNVNKHGISILGGMVGSSKKSNKGVIGNVISTCKQNGITVSGKGKTSAIVNNKISNIKNNGISITEKGKVYWIVKNTIKKCKKHGIWCESKGAKIKGNKGKTK